jgi:hypothetical protein
MRALLPLLLFLTACPDDDGTPAPMDGGADAFVARDGGRDAGVDAGRDAGVPMVDASPALDAGSDAAFDASLPDASFDAMMPVMDAGTDAGDACAVRDVYAQIEFTSVSSTSSCWFYSGPGDLGVEYQLGDEALLADPTRLLIGTSEFAATAAGFERVLQCPDEYRFSEALEGTWTGDVGTHPSCAATPAVFRGTYRYSECEVLPSRLCEPTVCTITADVTITLLPAPPTPMPMDAGVDGGHHTPSICAAACAGQDAAAAALMCPPDPSCMMNCERSLTPGGTCFDERVARWHCAARVGEPAWSCYPTIPASGIFIADPGPCEVENDRFVSCIVRPAPTGMCVEAVFPTGTGVAGDGCATTDDCAPGFFCNGPMCGGAGTCAPHPDRIDCLIMPVAEVCGCDGVTYENECSAWYGGVRVEHAGTCTP